MGDFERAQNFDGCGEHFVVALRAHYHADKRPFAHGVIIRGMKNAARVWLAKKSSQGLKPK
jgi:hypothetical protein